MATSNDKTEQKKQGEWSELKKWTMGILAAAVIGLGTAGGKFVMDYVSKAKPVHAPERSVEFVASNQDWDPSAKCLIKGTALLRGDDITVTVSFFQIQNLTQRQRVVSGVEAAFIASVGALASPPSVGKRVVVQKIIPAGKTIVLEPFATKIKLAQGEIGGGRLSFWIFDPGEMSIPVETAHGIF